MKNAFEERKYRSAVCINVSQASFKNYLTGCNFKLKEGDFLSLHSSIKGPTLVMLWRIRIDEQKSH